MAKFVQIIEFTTTKYDEGSKLIDKFREATKGRRTTVHAMTAKSRDEDNRYFTIVEFASYEDAMKNNELPETAELAEGLAALTDGPPTFHNLDVMREEND
jgi:hypothetical protein